MENSLSNTENISQVILNTINQIFNNLISSIDNNIYSTLDNLAFIDSEIINNSFFKKFLGLNSLSGILIIANSLLIAFTIYYGIKLLYSNFSGTQIERPYQFISKLLIFGLIMNYSYFICDIFIQLNSLISSSIREIGESIVGSEISFSSFIQNLNSVISINQSNFNLFSFDGLLKSFISICLFNLLFSYALRYIMVKIFVLLSPFAFLCLINYSTSWIFKSWFRTLFSLLIIQIFISIILFVIFTLDFNSPDVFSKIMRIGSIYALVRANSFIQQLFGGISTDISNNFHLMKGLLK